MAVVDEIPKSRITLKYPVEINGKKVKKELPFRMLVMGDFSLGKSKDRQIDFDAREVRQLDGKNLDKTIKDMGITLNLNVENKVDPSNEGSIDVNIPIENIKSFNPTSVAQSVPKIKALNLMKTLLIELQAMSDNNKAFRRKLNDILKAHESANELKSNLNALENYTLPKAEVANVIEGEIDSTAKE
ncbi:MULTISPECIES: type VI secretion system contractile sheath small subunit [Cysteiniphilum]|uniref:Type VI secretion protein n=1 Tax=Cysteiniphilum litorale TaxID=2056700 RepID=A0A8J2Z3Y7_9GAMM|nr:MULTISPECIES: type VI secretion system contractile sheath small subunit [Cysteiniphilum]GGF95458.1 type VI secretion protein [Cysteiniphilum litorale]